MACASEGEFVIRHYCDTTILLLVFVVLSLGEAWRALKALVRTLIEAVPLPSARLLVLLQRLFRYRDALVRGHFVHKIHGTALD